MSASPRITFSKTSNLPALEKALKRVAATSVYVGIPEDNSSRAAGVINNAELMFIQSNGSPIRSIPARPVIEPAIEYPPNKALITEELKEGAASILDYDPVKAKQHLQRAGMVAVNACQSWFTNPANNWAPNAPSTIASKGSDRPLIDTGQLRRAITSVLEEPSA